ncbi:hypothetical protein [Litoreibacter janthinus]|uniref:Uncharacterized protein n=1 Tax=Litoreibacter janthinus TaxID=670154 RepID=A0A1I6FQE9_9RHOB|nr:hypothetical protein [Litoreibacter janthinus]SFR32172.1 hypothetical protein SAMN04488002_0082 [Litoreibacter janthinus]
MIETKLSPRIIDAHARAHQERADAFARILHSIPKFVASIRIR